MSTFTGEEFFLKDHVVHGQKILPGVVYLEMARAAVEQAISTISINPEIKLGSHWTAGNPEQNQGIRLKNVVWARPILVNSHAEKVYIGLFAEENGHIAYEIYTEAGNPERESVIHSQGVATVSVIDKVTPLDLPGLLANINEISLSAEKCYSAFKSVGIHYGSGHQSIKELYAGKEQVLAKLYLPHLVMEPQNQYVLHPSLMDAALQASIGLTMGSSGDLPLKPFLPFALETLEIFEICTENMWAWIRRSEDSAAEGKAQKLDMDLCDESGNICAQMKGFSSRVLEGEVGSTTPSTSIAPFDTLKAPRPSTDSGQAYMTSSGQAIRGTLMVQPIWKGEVVSTEAVSPDYVQHLVMLCEMNPLLPKAIEAQIEGITCVCMQSKRKDLEKRYQDISIQTFKIIRDNLKKKPKGDLLIQIIIPAQGEKRLFCGLSGLLKTVHLENLKFWDKSLKLNRVKQRMSCLKNQRKHMLS